MESGDAAVLVIPHVPVVPESALTPVTEKDRVSSTVAETRTDSIGATNASTKSICWPAPAGSAS